MTQQNQSKAYRNELFRHLDGIVTAPSAFVLYEKGVLDYLIKHKKNQLSVLAKEFNANEGYLNVALRVMCSQGWLKQNVTSQDVEFSINDNSIDAFKCVPFYKDVVELLKFSEKHTIYS